MLHLTITANGVKAPYKFGKIVIYGHGVKLFERDDLQAFEMRKQDNGAEKLTEVYRGSPIAITLAGDIKRAVKENLNRKDNYTLSYQVEYFPRERRQALYIHESEIDVEDMGELLAMESADEKCYLHAVRLRFRHAFTVEELHIEQIQTGEHWTIPDGGRWGDGFGTEERPTYGLYDYTDSPVERLRARGKGVIKRWVSNERRENGDILSAFRGYSRIEYSEDRKRRVRIAEKLKAGGLRDFSYYDVEKLEKALGLKLEG